jgi:hypothetical protein
LGFFSDLCVIKSQKMKSARSFYTQNRIFASKVCYEFLLRYFMQSIMNIGQAEHFNSKKQTTPRHSAVRSFLR